MPPRAPSAEEQPILSMEQEGELCRCFLFYFSPANLRRDQFIKDNTGPEGCARLHVGLSTRTEVTEHPFAAHATFDQSRVSFS